MRSVRDDLMAIASGEITPEIASAWNSLTSGEIPQDAVREHIGKGGKKFKYIDHIWVTRQLREAFGQMWSMDVRDMKVLEDGSAVCIVTLELRFYFKGEYHVSHVSEVGAWEDTSGKMPLAMRIASAASRGLVRCAMRKFGIGEVFYSDIPEVTVQDAYKSLCRVGERAGMTVDDVRVLLRDNGFSPDDLLDRYAEAWKLVTEHVGDTNKATAV